MGDWKEETAGLLPQMVAWRRDFHRHPELSNQEFRTGEKVAEILEGLGMEVRTGVGGTGVIGILEGDRKGPTLAFRADMDALPVTEKGEAPYISAHPGVMHACGHDGHMAVVLGLATLLSRDRERLRGRVLFVFQPAEELMPEGGARRLIRDAAGILLPLDAVFGFHLWPELPVGVVGVHSGTVMAAGDVFEVIVKGRGAHSGSPHKAADSILGAAHILVGLQQIVSRRTDPLETVVVSVGSVSGGHNATNVLPEETSFRGTTRYLARSRQKELESQLARVVHGFGEACGCRCSFRYTTGYRETVNDPQAADAVREAAARVVGAENVRSDLLPAMTSEDFSEFLSLAPGCYFWLGAGTRTAPGHSLHSPVFDIEEEAMATGLAVLAGVARGGV